MQTMTSLASTALLALLLLTGLNMPTSCHASDLTVTALNCEYRPDPLGIDEPKPRLTWQVSSELRGARQSAYQILVASSPPLLANDQGDAWDSAKTASAETVLIPYQGAPLKSQTTYYWKVRVWDGNNQPSAWSDVHHWSMGILKDSEWTADFISFRDETPVHTDVEKLHLPAARQYRKDFLAKKEVKRPRSMHPLWVFTSYI